tara:strand:- start:42854 stop:43930 length:1077 start_codon:yes stop_codon:yes gene_type:complete
MKKYYFILSKFLRINYKSLKSLTNFSIIISTMLCVIFISIALSITDGFKENIISKIIFFDGYARVEFNDLNEKDLNYINTKDGISPYYESQYIVKSNYDSELITLFSSNNIKEKLSDISIFQNNNNSNGVYIGVGLKDKLFGSKSSNLSAVLISDSKLFKNINIIGCFETGVPLFDNHVIVSNITNLDFYESTPSGYIIDEKNFNDINGFFTSYISTYKDRYYDFLKWLNSYDLPIFILLLFILTVGLINNKFCYSIDVINREKDSFLLHNLGLSYNEIYYLYCFKFLLLNIIGIILGTIVALLLLYFELKFNFIQIPSEIYFTSSVPIIFKIQNFIYAPLVILLQVFYFTLSKYEFK